MSVAITFEDYKHYSHFYRILLLYTTYTAATGHNYTQLVKHVISKDANGTTRLAIYWVEIDLAKIMYGNNAFPFTQFEYYYALYEFDMGKYVRLAADELNRMQSPGIDHWEQSFKTPNGTAPIRVCW